MHLLGISVFVLAWISHNSAVPTPQLSLSLSNTTTATLTLNTKASTGAAPNTVADGSAANGQLTRHLQAYQNISNIACSPLPIITKPITARGRPTTDFIDTHNLSFHVHRGRPAIGFKIVSTCYQMLNDALVYCPSDIVDDAYSTAETAFYPSMYIGMLNADYQLRWGDVVVLANGLIDLVREANGGKVPKAGGWGWEYRGDIYVRGVSDDHEEEGLMVGHFYMGRY